MTGTKEGTVEHVPSSELFIRLVRMRGRAVVNAAVESVAQQASACLELPKVPLGFPGFLASRISSFSPPFSFSFSQLRSRPASETSSRFGYFDLCRPEFRGE